ncbi:hypothetical protein [Alistipes indistinctus]|uniref:hypothetical protein n=1 Tax=Alistipes indistinctus TaxID=626932 RepID=UPI0026DA91F5|nr:hypothetical protein [Alistipes indistinctus]
MNQNSEGSPISAAFAILMVFLSPDLTLPGVYPQSDYVQCLERVFILFGKPGYSFACLRLYLLPVYFFLNLYCAGRGAHRQG